MTNYQYTEDGVRLYKCLICLDQGWVHPRKEDGKPDYSKTIPCQCRQNGTQATETQVKFN
jgi:hypothetical protein